MKGKVCRPQTNCRKVMEMTRRSVRNGEGSAVAAEIHPGGAPSPEITLILAVATVALSAVHFWPFGQSKAWQMACPSNLTAAVWIVLAGGYALWQRSLDTIAGSLPHVSVLAFLAICLLSLAFAQDAERALSHTAKSGLMLIGGYTLFHTAMCDRRSVSILLGVATVATAFSVGGCLVARYGFRHDSFGFHESGYKYGTYAGIFAPLCSVYLLQHTGWRRAVGAALLLAANASCATVGAITGMAAGVVVLLLTARGGRARGLALGALALGSTSAVVFPPPVRGTIRDDLSLVERKTDDLRQRYIEWQAEINLLAERGAVGTGAGSINDYRSEYYYRLPKLNTLEAFDQNGWLARAAELGIPGLVCFSWAILAYFRRAARSLGDIAGTSAGDVRTFASAGLAGLAAACTTNVFSSVHYNGVLIAFVFVLALIAKTHVLFEASSHASD